MKKLTNKEIVDKFKAHYVPTKRVVIARFKFTYNQTKAMNKMGEKDWEETTNGINGIPAHQCKQ